jgi:hypothetical protein
VKVRRITATMGTSAALVLGGPAAASEAEMATANECLISAMDPNRAPFVSDIEADRLGRNLAAISLHTATTGNIISTSEAPDGSKCPGALRVKTGIKLVVGPWARLVPFDKLSTRIGFTNFSAVNGKRVEITAENATVLYDADCDRARKLGHGYVDVYTREYVSFTQSRETARSILSRRIGRLSCSRKPRKSTPDSRLGISTSP